MSLHHLLPIHAFQSGFTTCTFLKNERIEIVSLNDGLLDVHKVSSKTTHSLVKPPPEAECDSHNPPPPQIAWEAFYPKGSINPSAELPGGFSFYLSGPDPFKEALKDATEVLFSYRVMLQADWDWVKGGKLPGVFGGVGDLSYGCTGGRKEQRCQCFNVRPMWRPAAVGELYTYLPLTIGNSTRLLKVPPLSLENSDFGFSVGRGALSFVDALGKWLSVAIKIKLNDVGVNNGEIDLWINGTHCISIDELELRESGQSHVRGMHFQTFFGGHTNEWASSRDQRAWFSDVTGVIIK